MRSRSGLIERSGLGLCVGYLLFFLLRHEPQPRAVPGILAITPGYLAAAEPFNPFYIANLRLGLSTPLLMGLGLLLVLTLLFLVYFRTLHSVQGQAVQPGQLGLIVAGVLLASVPLLLCPYLLSRDIYSYIIYGRMAALYGANPAITAPIAYSQDTYFQYLVTWTDVPSVYGPLWTLLSHAITLLVEGAGGGLWLYLLAYKLAMLAAHVASTLLIWHILPAERPGYQLAGTLLYAWNPTVLIEFVASAHNDALMIFLILLAALWTQRGHWRWAVAALVAAALIKWIAAVLLPLWALYWLRREPTWRGRLLLAAQAAAIGIVVPLVVALPYGEVLRSLSAPLGLQSAMQAENSLGALAIRGTQDALAWLGLASARDPGWRPAAELLVGGVSKGLVLLAWPVALYAVWRRPTFERLLQACCWLLLAILLLSPIFRVWYVTWPLALAALLDWRPAGRTAATFAAAAPLMYLQAQSPAWVDALALLPAIGLVIYELWQARLRRRSGARRPRAEGRLPRAAGDEWSKPPLGG
ncbi:MAG TPA: hypothetical protein VFU22_23455 [Roseiflexaceae bacterium]|nr:hypothetical protein [Roseiflexaceae bacterium]